MGDSSRQRPRLFTLHWWVVTSVCFAFLGFLGIGLWLLFAPLLAFYPAATGSWWLVASVSIPLALSAGLATIWDPVRAAGKILPRSRRRLSVAVIAAGFSFPLVAAPLCFLALWKQVEQQSARDLARLHEYLRRPIVAGPQDGFCLPPVHRVRDGLPIVTLTARLPHSGRFQWFVHATDRAGHFCQGTTDTVLESGVHSIMVRLDQVQTEVRDKNGASWRENMSADQHAWPLTVTHLGVQAVEMKSDFWNDNRDGDSLATIQRSP